MQDRPPLDPEALSRLYRERFAQDDASFKDRAWAVLCDRVFQTYVDPDSTVVDLGAGGCEFINNINCRERIAVDLNPDAAANLRAGRFLQTPSTDLSAIGRGTVDVVFTSNFLEHLPDKQSVLRTFVECHRIMRDGGQLIVLMPNIRYLNGRYWDFFDHHTPLTHFSLVEGLRLEGFIPEVVIPRFLPYTVKQRSLPRSLVLLRLYLRSRFLWPIFGRQMLVVARRDVR
jgi:SAM-dependent methyltransferase